MKKQYDLCLEVLERINKVGVLSKIIVIGSWCKYFYKDYFSDVDYSSSIRTRDIDFLVPIPFEFKGKVDIPDLLKDLGFVLDFHIKGLIRLNHPELIIEFLVPERRKGADKPYPLPQLGINAQALRFLDFLVKNSEKFNVNNLVLNLPHPAAFALQKLIVSSRRLKEEKKIKERQEAIHVLNCLISKREEEKFKELFKSMPEKWQRKVIMALEDSEEKNILTYLR